MNALEMAAVLILAALCITWIVRDDRRTKRQQAWDDHIESIVTDTDLYPGPRKLTDAPAVDRISEIIAANEAARADWTEPNRWGA